MLFVIIVNILQNKRPNSLPKVLQTWNFLPQPLRSLEYYDKLITKYCLCCNIKDEITTSNEKPLSLQRLSVELPNRSRVKTESYTNEAYSIEL